VNYSKLTDAIRQTASFYRMMLAPACTR
jgi:hypothetical protein